MPTIKDVAKLANVSTATVSAALNGTAYVSPTLKERVERAVQKLGYSADGVARNLKKGISNLVGLIIDDVTSPFYAELVEKIEAAAYDEGYSILLCHTGQNVSKERSYLSLLKTHRVAAIIWAPTGKAEDYPAAEFEHLSIPLVFVDRVVSTFQSYDSVLLNNRMAGLQATDYLLDLGHRRIGLISGAEHLEPARERSAGYQEAFRKRGIHIDDKLIRNGNFREAEAFDACIKLLTDEPRVSALIVANNPMFIGVLRALKYLGLACPDDVSLVAVDGFPLAAVLNPPVTTVRQPVGEIAGLAVQLIKRRLPTHSPIEQAIHKIVEPTLIVRASCKPYQGTQLAPAK